MSKYLHGGGSSVQDIPLDAPQIGNKTSDGLPASEITGDGLTAVSGTLGGLLSLLGIAVQLPPPKPPSYARLQALTMSLHWATTSELLDDVLTRTEPTGDPNRKQVYEEMPERKKCGVGRCEPFRNIFIITQTKRHDGGSSTQLSMELPIVHACE